MVKSDANVVLEQLRSNAMAALCVAVGVDMHRDPVPVFNELMQAGARGDLSINDLEELDSAIDDAQRLRALDSPWVFGYRYCGHKFVSTDPMCPHCGACVPHRTLITCPTCGRLGPWTFIERKLPSSYVHYLLVERVRRVFDNTLILPNGTHRADGMFSAIPRGGAKSTWLCEVMILWCVLTGRSRCTLLLSNTGDQATQRSTEIKGELEGNAAIIDDFGPQLATRQDTRTWTTDDFVLPNGSRVVARGAMVSLRGVKNKQYRPDLVVSDDSDDDKYITTPEMAKKLYDWWDMRVNPACSPSAVTFFHGTVIGERSLLWQGLTGHRGFTSAKLVVPALRDAPGCGVCGLPSETIGPMACPVCNGVTTAVQPSSFWGSRFSPQALDAIRRKIGYWAFEAEFQQRVHDDSKSWFERAWLEKSRKDDLAPPRPEERRIIPWQIIAQTLNSEEALDLAVKVDPSYKRKGEWDHGPYQLVLQAWDPAWAREKDPAKAKEAYMGTITAGLTMDDRMDIWDIDRKRGLTLPSIRQWMYSRWVDHALVKGPVETRGQTGMIIERNGAGIIFQNDVEQHWASVPVIDHQTGAEKHHLENGIPGMAGWFKDDRVVVRGMQDREMVDALMYELKGGGTTPQKDLLMTLWFIWSYMNKWIRDVRDPARYDELTRRAEKWTR